MASSALGALYSNMPNTELLSGIYVVRNTVNGHFYVGSSVRSIRCRRNHHFNRLQAGKHSNSRLQAAWNKYGRAAFVWEPIALVGSRDVRAIEERLLARLVGLPTCYNLSRDANGSPLGTKRSEETRAKIAAANRRRIVTDETKAKLSAHFKGRPSSMGPEGRARALAAARGQNGKTISQEQRAKIAATLRGRTLPPDVVEKVRAAGIGRRHSAETRAKMRASNIGRRHSEESKAKMRERCNSADEITRRKAIAARRKRDAKGVFLGD